MSTQPLPALTAERYLEIERAAQVRSEYIGGQMYAMAGASVNHGTIVGNTLVELLPQLRGTRFRAVANDLRVYIDRAEVFTYPDIVIACGPLCFHQNRNDTITDSTAIVEVLSPATQNNDRGEKFDYYRSLPSFSEYLLLRQDRMVAEHYTKQSDDTWNLRDITQPEETIQLSSVGCRLTLRNLYDRVEFEG